MPNTSSGLYGGLKTKFHSPLDAMSHTFSCKSWKVILFDQISLKVSLPTVESRN